MSSENLLESSCEACREDAPRVTQEEICLLYTSDAADE